MMFENVALARRMWACQSECGFEKKTADWEIVSGTNLLDERIFTIYAIKIYTVHHGLQTNDTHNHKNVKKNVI